MPTLIDTNVLLRSVQPGHPMHAVGVRAVEVLLKKGEPLVIAVQNVAEFWNAATRSVANNGLGFTLKEAELELAELESTFTIVSENSASYSIWKSLVIDHRVSGAQVHDARLAAVMKARGVERIVTFNVADFTRFDGIEAIHPAAIS